jgi:hypothetical protein
MGQTCTRQIVIQSRRNTILKTPYILTVKSGHLTPTRKATQSCDRKLPQAKGSDATGHSAIKDQLLSSVQKPAIPSKHGVKPDICGKPTLRIASIRTECCSAVKSGVH